MVEMGQEEHFGDSISKLRVYSHCCKECDYIDGIIVDVKVRSAIYTCRFCGRNNAVNLDCEKSIEFGDEELMTKIGEQVFLAVVSNTIQ